MGAFDVSAWGGVGGASSGRGVGRTTHRSSSFFIFAAATIFIDLVIFWMFVVDVIRARSSCSDAIPRAPIASGARSAFTEVRARLILSLRRPN